MIIKRRDVYNDFAICMTVDVARNAFSLEDTYSISYISCSLYDVHHVYNMLHKLKAMDIPTCGVRLHDMLNTQISYRFQGLGFISKERIDNLIDILEKKQNLEVDNTSLDTHTVEQLEVIKELIPRGVNIIDSRKYVSLYSLV